MSGVDELPSFIESRIVAFQSFQFILVQLELGFQAFLAEIKPVVYFYQNEERQERAAHGEHYRPRAGAIEQNESRNACHKEKDTQQADAVNLCLGLGKLS